MSLNKVNRLLSITNILVALYILLIPFLPWLLFIFREKTTEPPVIVSQSVSSQKPQFPGESRLVIPSILLDEEVFEGPSRGTLNKGIWRRPNTSVPDAGSNTVLAGHVFTYDKPEGVFYHLNKVKVGDEAAVYWNGSEYLYEVTEIREVPATAIEIEAPSSEEQLTLYTCTPVWNPVNRLVVIAKLRGVTTQ